VKVNAKRIFMSFLTVVGVFVAATIGIVIVNLVNQDPEKSMWITALISGSVAAGLSFPVLIWFAIRPPQLGGYSAYALEEVSLTEEELIEAVSVWVFMKHRQRVEDVPTFLEDEDGNVSCKVMVRKE
jgi:hypothetical protein